VRASVRGTIVLMLVATGLLGLPRGPLATGGTEPRPNVLIIVTDDQRADTLSATPKTRKWFRAGGTEFPGAVVTTPLCCPSRGSFFTGMYVHNHLVRGNFDSSRLDQRATVQRYMQEQGYRTGIVGKYFNDWELENDPPFFDRWAIFRGGYENRPYNVNGRVREIGTYSTSFIGDRATRMLRTFEGSDAAPWLLFVTPNAPHGPLVAEPRYRDASVPVWRDTPATRERDLSDKPAGVQSADFGPDRAAGVWEAQLRTLLSVDDMVGRLMQELGRLGERKRTLAFFASDNGYLLAEHGLSDKRWPYTQSIRVPFFVRWANHFPGGTTDDRLAANIDIVPTVLDAAGVSPDPEYPLDGRSLLQGATRDHLLLEHFRDPLKPNIPAWASITTLEFQYTEYYDQDTGEISFREYYDLLNDPWQLENLYADSDPHNDPPAETTAALSARLARDLRCEGTSGLRACP
jgi:arylsulfatase A-like enzyme